MDAETSRLVLLAVISASAAVVAGLGGATLSAVINRKNTKDTLAAGREDNERRWHLQVNRENELWLRDNKQQAYAKFVSAVTAAASHAYSLDPSYARNALMAYDEVRLVGPREVRRAGKQVMNEILEIGRLISAKHSMDPEPDANADSLEHLAVETNAGIDEHGKGRIREPSQNLRKTGWRSKPKAPGFRRLRKPPIGFVSVFARTVGGASQRLNSAGHSLGGGTKSRGHPVRLS